MNNKRLLFENDPDWKVREHINPSTGNHTNTYFYKNRKCYCIILESKLAQQLAGYSLIEKDIRSIKIWLDEILPYVTTLKKNQSQKSPDRKTFNLVKGLFVSSVTFYGKCFTQCDGRKVKLRRSDIKDEKLKNHHDDIMKFRHNFTAHSGDEKIELVKIALVLDSKKNRKTLPHIITELLQPDTVGETDIKDYFELLEYLQDFVTKRMKKISDKIYAEEILPKGRDYWYKKVKKFNQSLQRTQKAAPLSLALGPFENLERLR